MNTLRIKLLGPTILTVALCLGVIAYISYQQHLSFQTSAAQTTRHIEHDVQSLLLYIQTENHNLADFISRQWSFIDNVALGTSQDLLDQVESWTGHKDFDIINVYELHTVLLACAENPGLFAIKDDISPIFAEMKTDSSPYPVAVFYNGKIALLSLKRVEGNYGPIGFLAVGRYLTKENFPENDSFYAKQQASVHFSYHDKEYFSLGSNTATASSSDTKTTPITLLPGTDNTARLNLSLIEDISQAEQDFRRQLLIVILVFSAVSLVVIVFSRKITMRVTTDLEKYKDELELLVQERTVELRGSEERFRMLVDSLDSLVYVADMETYKLLFINDYGKKIWGNIVGKTCWQALQTGQTGPCEFCSNSKLLDANGKPKEIYVWEFQNTVNQEWYECRDQAICWPDGRYVRMEIATKITERKLASMALGEEKELLAVTLRSIGDGVITTDTQGLIVIINKVAEQLTGWSSAEAVGRPLAEVFHIVNEGTRQTCESPVDKVMASGGIVGLANHTALISKNGQERSIADSGAPIRDKESNIIGVVLVFRDVTEQLRTEEELTKVKKLESIGVLAGGIAHDFNNILAAILGNISLSLLDHTLTIETKKLLAEAEKASLRARDLTQQLLTFAKGGAPVRQTASLVEVVKDSADFVLHGDKVACRYIFQDDLWPVTIDKGQISQVVQNIVLNASHAMPGGGIIEIACENVTSANTLGKILQKGAKYVKMTIKDNGIGIPANVIDKIFDPYFSTKQQGSGLGLAITHSIVRKHDGYITAESIPGAGTTFTIYLPASTQDSAPGKEEKVAALPIRKAKILIMDDEKQVREMAQAMLNRMGHEVVLAIEGLEAVRVYQESMDNGTPIDITIMDLTVPGGMGGEDALKKLLSINPKAKVIVCSGYSTDPVMASFKEYGFCGALVKPFQMKDLMETISNLLSED